MKISRKSSKEPPENTIALINIVFLMLIFFIVAGTIAAPVNKSISLPNVSDQPIEMPKADVLQITHEGELFWGTLQTTPDAIIAQFQASGRTQLKIMADKKLNAHQLVTLLDKFKRAGLLDIKLVTLKGVR